MTGLLERTALLDLEEWLADPSTPAFVTRSIAAQEEDDHRFYLDPDDPNIRYWSVTHILGMAERRPWLERWHSRSTAQFAVRHWAEVGDVLAAQGEKAAALWLQHVALMRRSVAAEVGTYLHDVLESLALDRPLPLVPEWLLEMELNDEPITQARLDAWADGLMAFFADFSPKILMSEATLLMPRYDAAGTGDLLVDIPGFGLIFIDLKTGREPDSHAPIQLTAYTKMEQVILPLGVRASMPKVERPAILHLRPEYSKGYKILDVPHGKQQWHDFLDARRQFLSILRYPRIGRKALYPPLTAQDGTLTARTVPMVEDVDAGRTFPRLPLVRAGFEWLDQLTDFTADELLSNTKTGAGVKRVGPVGIEAIRAALATHGLALKGEQITGQEVA